MLLQIYFWFMVLYLAASVMAKLFKAREYAALGNTAAFWAEELAGYVLLGLGLWGVHGHVTGTPYLSAGFWQAFLVILAVFSAGQFFMPKMKLLRREKGTRVVAAAALVGVLMLVPMAVALVDYALHGFPS